MVNVEWPMCVPGVGVVVAMETGRKVTCHLQADWMYAEVSSVVIVSVAMANKPSPVSLSGRVAEGGAGALIQCWTAPQYGAPQ